MGLFIKLLLLALVIALAAPFVLKGPDGEPMMSVADIKKPGSLQDMAGAISRVEHPFKKIGQEAADSPEPAASKTKVYSWRDEQGSLHYSNVAPSVSAKVKTLQINPNLNVIKMQKREEPGKATNLAVAESPQNAASASKVFKVYTPQGAQKLFEDAKAVEQTLHDRKRAQDEIIDAQ